MSAFTERITPDDIRWLRSQILADPTDFPRDFTGWIGPWVGLAGIDVPISQIVGFTQFTAKTAASVAASEGTASNTFADLATPGPTLSGVSDGSYLFMWSAAASNDTSPNAALMGISVNGGAVSDDDAALTFFVGGSGVGTTIVSFQTATLSAGSSNTVAAKYRRGGGGGTAYFARRKLVGFKYSNA